MDLRERVVAAVASGGMSRNRAAKQFGLGISTVINLVKRLDETGSVAAGQMCGHKPKKIAGEQRPAAVRGIRLDAYQLLPLRKALRLPRVSLLIADDVGSGKTVETGLVVRELLLRRRIIRRLTNVL